VNSGKVRSIISPIPIRTVLAWAAALALVFWATSAMAGPGLLFPERKPRIAIDPGHGGADSGAQGPTGQLEKTIALELARQLALTLETDYEVILTRSDDYRIAPRQRSAIANQAKADLFIGIHTGAAFLHGTNGKMVYYYSPLKNGVKMTTDTAATKDQQRWDRAYVRHKDASISLAGTLAENIEKLDDASGCKMHGAPLAVLEGADMPAVLIEVGHITHPATEKKLRSPQSLAHLVRTIKRGVEQYLKLSEFSSKP
jgi:N-acetylmuramoyl-L-alanine amidase